MADLGSSHAVGGAILAGGSSTRMGTHKAFIQIDGSTMIERCASALSDSGVSPIVAVGGPAGKLVSLGIQCTPDMWPGEGPLGGVITALDSVSTEIVVVLSCDLLQPSARAISETIDALAGHDLAVPLCDGEAQWLHSAWRHRVLGAITTEFEEGARSIRSAVSDLSVNFFDGHDPDDYRDADYPSDLP